MIKLKNLWKIALATMAMSAMLVACDTTKKEDEPGSSGGEQKVVAKGGEGVYSYTVNITDISKAWGGKETSPAFTIMLLTDAQLETCKTAANFKQATAENPEYQIGAYGNLKIDDTNKKGDFVVYGATAVNDVYQYYTGVVATVKDTTFTVTVDMTKLVLTDLKACFLPGDVNKNGESVMTNDDIVNLKGYKPYVLALGAEDTDPDNYQMSAWNADLMKMTAGATLPSNATKAAPVVPTCKDLTSVAGTINGWTHAALTNNAVDFTATEDKDGKTDVAFAFTNGSWDFKACGVEIKKLDKEYKLVEGAEGNITFAAKVLTTGSEYTATLRVAGNHEAYVTVTAKK